MNGFSFNATCKAHPCLTMGLTRLVRCNAGAQYAPRQAKMSAHGAVPCAAYRLGLWICVFWNIQT